MQTRFVRLICALTLTALLLTSVPWPPDAGQPAHAQTPVVNGLLGLFRIGGAFRARNRVYREAADTQGDMNAYYDALREQAGQQLLDRQLAGTGQLTAENRTQTRVYIRLQAALQAEQEAVTQQIESEKNQARQQFNRRLTNELIQILVRSPGGQSLIGDLRRTVGEVREAAEAVQAAIAGNRPFDALAEALADKVGDIPLLRGTAYNLGQHVGRKVDRALGGFIGKVDNAMANLEGGMANALSEIEQIDGELARFDQAERQPASLIDIGGPLGNVQGVDRANAAVDVAAQAYTNAAILAGALRNPTEAERSSMRDRIRDQLLQNRLTRLGQAGQRVSHVACDGVGQADYIAAANELGYPVEQPADPATARYLVCRDTESGALVHAALIGGALVQATETSEVELAETDQVDQPPGDLPADRCSLHGEGDFVIENLAVQSSSSTCEDSEYPYGYPAEPLLMYLAAFGKWTIVQESPQATTWSWQATQPLEGFTAEGTAVDNGSTLEIEASLVVPREQGSTFPPVTHANGYALLGLLPLVPLSLRLTRGRRRRYALLALATLALLLTAQSCIVYGTFSGTYSFPIPETGFACEVDSDNPNLAEMPGSGGQSVMQLTVDSVDEDGNVTDSDPCEGVAHMNGLGVLKRDGFYTEADLSAE